MNISLFIKTVLCSVTLGIGSATALFAVVPTVEQVQNFTAAAQDLFVKCTAANEMFNKCVGATGIVEQMTLGAGSVAPIMAALGSLDSFDSQYGALDKVELMAQSVKSNCENIRMFAGLAVGVATFTAMLKACNGGACLSWLMVSLATALGASYLTSRCIEHLTALGKIEIACKQVLAKTRWLRFTMWCNRNIKPICFTAAALTVAGLAFLARRYAQ